MLLELFAALFFVNCLNIVARLIQDNTDSILTLLLAYCFTKNHAFNRHHIRVYPISRHNKTRFLNHSFRPQSKIEYITPEAKTPNQDDQFIFDALSRLGSCFVCFQYIHWVVPVNCSIQ